MRFAQPADVALSQFFRSNRQLGQRDRAMIADTVYDVLRHRRWLEILSNGDPAPRRLLLAAMMKLEGQTYALTEPFAWRDDKASTRVTVAFIGISRKSSLIFCAPRACTLRAVTSLSPSVPKWRFDNVSIKYAFTLYLPRPRRRSRIEVREASEAITQRAAQRLQLPLKVAPVADAGRV